MSMLADNSPKPRRICAPSEVGPVGTMWRKKSIRVEG